MTWAEFIVRPAPALDRSRAGSVVVIEGRRDRIRLCPRTLPGPEIRITVPSSQFEARRREIGDVLRSGGAVAITRWGAIDGVLWTDAAEAAFEAAIAAEREGV